MQSTGPGQRYNRDDSLPEGNALFVTGSLFAPTIRYHQGRFYIVCTNVLKESSEPIMRNFILFCNDIWASDWSNPTDFDFRGIDPSIFFDEDGKVFVQGSWRSGPPHAPDCEIRQLEIDVVTGKSLSEAKAIWNGAAGKRDAEGPHSYKKESYYYLVVDEAGTFEHHLISISRSQDIWGPYESYEGNPILTADGTKEYIQHTGHGDLFQGRQGR